MAAIFDSVTSGPPWSLLAAAIAVLAAYVALDVVKRARLAPTPVAMSWLLGGAVALGTGIWSAHVVGLSGLSLSFSIGYDPQAALLSWVGAIAACLFGLTVGGGSRASAPRVVLAGAVTGLSIVLAQVAITLSTGMRPGIEWRWAELAAAVGAAALGAITSFCLFFIARVRVQRGDWPWQLPSAVLLGLATLISQQMVIDAAHLAGQTFSAHDRRLPADALAMLASVGSVAFLAMMLLSSVLEARIRVSLQRAKHELKARAITDPLTELPTRQVFEAELVDEVQRADAARSRLALLLIDPGGVSAINDTYGHLSGDQLLREMAARLRRLARPQDRVARLGGDEFLILLTGNPRKEDAARLANQLLESLSQPFSLDGRDMSVTCSIGVAMYPEQGARSALISHADAAVKSAKATGGATYCFFEPRMLADAREQRELLRDLRLALDKGQLELYYQPKIDAPSGEVTGAEALMRWHHPQRGMVSPVVFIPIAERFGLISTLGNWVINEACRQARVWRDEGMRMRVAINLSAYQLRQPDLADRIADALKRYQINPKLITCEITESVAMDDDDATLRVFAALEQVGVHISIDDFGTGYSSLSYLRKLPAEELKIDRSFVLDLETSSDARAVVDAVVKLAQALGLKVVAEGVETEGQNQILRSLGCDELQGFLFAKPMSAKALSLWAMKDEGPRSLAFRNSLFAETLPGVM